MTMLRGATLCAASFIAGGLGCWPGVLAAEERASGPEVGVRLIHPERQARAVLRLFEGARAPHPAAALTAWKRAAAEPDRLGKRLEATISFFNPEMAGEWSTLHDASFRLAFQPDDGAPGWSFVVPADDGTFAALVTALRLTSGASESSLPGASSPVERLGGPGSPLAAEVAGGLVLASSRAELERSRGADERLAQRAPESGLVFHFVVGDAQDDRLKSQAMRRAIVAVRRAGVDRVEGRGELVGGELAIELVTRPKTPVPGAPEAAGPIDPAWLDWAPAGRTAAFAGFSVGNAPGFWDRVFSIGDGVDRADPARAGLAPFRVRVNLIATTVGVSLEADLWPHLRGVSAGWLDSADAPAGSGAGFLVLHLDDAALASRLAERAAPRLSGTLTLGKPRPAGARGPCPVRLGVVSGRPLEMAIRGSSVAVAWGESAMASILNSVDHPAQSVRGEMSRSWPAGPSGIPARCGAFWPGRTFLPFRFLDSPTDLVQSLAEGPPIVWAGWNRGGQAVDRLGWPGLRGLVHRFLERISQTPPHELQGAQPAAEETRTGRP